MAPLARLVPSTTLGLLLLVAWSLPSAGRAEDKEKKDSPPWELIVDAPAGVQLQAAAEYVRDEDWKNAVRLLQHGLDGNTETLAQLPGGDGRAGRTVSVPAEAERLLARMPEAGPRVYEREYGPRALTLLEDARTSHDAEALTRIVQRYLYTSSGPAALQELASLHFKAGRLHLAGMCYARLLDHVGPARWSNEDLYQAATALYYSRAIRTTDRVLMQLLSRARQNVVRVGERQITVEKLREEIELATPNRMRQWSMYRGDVERTNRGGGAPPLLAASWRNAMIFAAVSSAGEEAIHDYIKEAEKKLAERREPIISAFAPLAVTVQRGATQKTLLIYKNYFGVTAVDPRNGRLEWLSPSTWSLQRMYSSNGGTQKRQAASQWLKYYQAQHPQVLFENSTVNTLSTDGQYVYVVDDLAIPPIPREAENGGWSGGAREANSWEIRAAIDHSRLLALSLERSGALSFELGGEDRGPLADCYFLGPPLPLDDRLFMLVEKKQQLCLVCIEKKILVDGKKKYLRPHVAFLKPLVRLATPLVKDPLRRIQAAHLAYSDGILVCPTNAGVALGFDVLAGRVAWVYPYTQKNDDTRGERMHWKVTAPTITDGKVVFTPPDEPVIHCVSLTDGARRWSHKKNSDDLYLGCIAGDKVLIVGKKRVYARSLATGEILWTQETGLPSGQGVLANDVFYVPLQQGTLSQKPEICAIDVNKGQVISRQRGHVRTMEGNKEEASGNLLFVEGSLISISPWEVVSNPSLKAQLDRLNERLSHNPQEPSLLTERASLRLAEGKLASAIADLRMVLKNKPNKEIRHRARSLLFDALTQVFQQDKSKAEPFLDEYKALTEVDTIGIFGKELAKRQTEQRQRQRTYSMLVAQLRESQGRLREALQVYLHLAESGAGEEMMDLPSEPARRIRVTVLVRGQIADLLKKATPQQRKELEEIIDRSFQQLQKKKDDKPQPELGTWDELYQILGLHEGNGEKLRIDPVTLLGPEFATGREARLRLAQRLLGEKKYLEAELHLLPVRRWRDDPVRAARALEMLGQLMTTQGQFGDAVYFYRRLRAELGTTRLPDGNTGADIFDALVTDKRFLPYLEETDLLAPRDFTIHKQTGNFSTSSEVFHFEHIGERLPFFRTHRVGLELERHILQLSRRTDGKVLWDCKLTPTSFAALLSRFDDNPSPYFPCHTLGHLLVLPVDRLVFVIDPLGQRLLWEKDTLPEADATADRTRLTWIDHDSRDGSTRLNYPDNWTQHLGYNLVLTPAALCLVTRHELQALDPRTGKLLWSRSDVPNSVRLLDDDEYLILIEENTKGEVLATRVLRVADGSPMAAPDFATRFTRRVQVFGRTLATVQSDKDSLRLQLYDMPTGATVWQGKYAARSIVLSSAVAHLTGIVEPDGRVHIVDLQAHKEVMTGKLREPAEDLLHVRQIHLLADLKNFYLACDAFERDPHATENVRARSNLAWKSGLRDVPVDGKFYAFSRKSGDVLWSSRVNNSRLVLSQFADLPVVLFTRRQPALRADERRATENMDISFTILAKWNGRMLLDDKINQGELVHTLLSDPAEGRIELGSDHLKLGIASRLRPAAGRTKP